ncbi:Uu.00g109510.m01.CDS01 [Anthostomella pinea]|uniref:Uu.00g109510.m01.CDS01 n=1 Tax=Anthostomella pinea TaxID=933095 RepID=A0AAI8VEQ8_9PEZI|nr:Uu.00g109510.m01.CDS01 [Anthostomella pinea]
MPPVSPKSPFPMLSAISARPYTALLTRACEQRHQTLPPAQTSSARAAMQSFYCDLCSKGYSRMNDYEAHLSSYDHSHRQRMKDMKQMVKDPTAGARARKAEAKADGLISIKLGDAGANNNNSASAAGGGGFKKGGFKKSGFKSAFAPPVAEDEAKDEKEKEREKATIPGREEKAILRDENVESDTDDERYEVYNPRFPTE